MISVIIPDYKNPQYLDMCLKSAIENQVNKNEIIVVVDGMYNEWQNVINKYKSDIQVLPLQKNKGLAYALNVGVSQATNDYVLLVNEDNVFPKDWDIVCEDLPKQFVSYNRDEDYWEHIRKTTYFSFNQIEPNPSMYEFTHKDFGDTLEKFKYNDFLDFEKTIRIEAKRDYDMNYGGTFPFLIEKRLYMGVGGFDLLYPSPFVVDWDFFYKLQIMGINCKKVNEISFYHFINKSTKQNENIDMWGRGDFTSGEIKAHEIFKYKWGFQPKRLKENKWRITK